MLRTATEHKGSLKNKPTRGFSKSAGKRVSLIGQILIFKDSYCRGPNGKPTSAEASAHRDSPWDAPEDFPALVVVLSHLQTLDKE